MAKKRARKAARRTKSRAFVEYNSLTFILFLVFVLLVSVLLVAKMVAAN
ncbi:MAG: hypothetical protein HYT06_01350 [Candidatus Levybacteria bacterium]|nr:hypothetical protein [Candidatus Levybacteria bacterium]